MVMWARCPRSPLQQERGPPGHPNSELEASEGKDILLALSGASKHVLCTLTQSCTAWMACMRSPRPNRSRVPRFKAQYIRGQKEETGESQERAQPACCCGAPVHVYMQCVPCTLRAPWGTPLYPCELTAASLYHRQYSRCRQSRDPLQFDA